MLRLLVEARAIQPKTESKTTAVVIKQGMLQSLCLSFGYLLELGVKEVPSTIWSITQSLFVADGAIIQNLKEG